ncbi:MAG TPA: type 4a pilus biogenesis protein PilO [Gammaproteobacteria bacterium]
MNLSDFQNLDPNNIGGWPLVVKALIILLLCAAVLFAGYWFDTQHQIVELQTTEKKEVDLKQVFETKQRKAANLEPLKAQLEEMKQTFGDLLRLLPNRTEIEGLLVDISQSGLAAGLEFQLFKPAAEQPAEFYAIQPIQIRVIGGYHQLAAYVSAVAALPRIVTQHDISITPAGKSGTGENLVMSMTAKTYRYLEEDEISGK